jgi:hypothetical protein
MKILIGFLLALFISGQVYAQSNAEVLEKGKIIQQIDKKKWNSSISRYIVVYNGWAYYCSASYKEVMCAKITGSSGDADNYFIPPDEVR